MGAVAKFHARYKAETAGLVPDGWNNLWKDAAPDWLQALRLRARDNFLSTGLPTPKLERFKYFNLPAWLKNQTLRYAQTDMVFDGEIKFVNPLQKNWSQVMEFIERAPPYVDKYGDFMLMDLATSYLNDGIFWGVPKNQILDKPLNLVITGHHDAFTVPRTCIKIGAGSTATLIEYHIGGGTYWNNAVTHIELEEGARLRHYRLQENGDQSCYTQMTHTLINRGASYEAFTLTAGSQLSRNQIHVELQGEGAECHLNGINLLSGKQTADTTITIEHQAPHCQSNQNYRSVVTNSATGVFQGKVHVHQAAQKTDGYQLSNALLLSPQATMNTKPELEIYADDVKCSHGATTGRLDDNALFYLQSRGIPRLKAQALLIEAFLSQVVEQISDTSIREQAVHIIARWLHKDKAAGHQDWLV